MKRTMKKMLSFGLVAAMSLTMLAGCGNSKDATNDTNVSNGQEEKKPTGDVKIGVLVQDVSGEEALGFRSYYENEKDEKEQEQNELEKIKAEQQKAIANFLGQNYSPIGSTSAKCFKTTDELIYDLSNIISVRPTELAKQLTDAGYHVEYLAGQPYWVMYEK